ncbi:ACP synthase [Trinickia symbiotica]|uniref:ACP synthase n=1 Tax=Trinickia symbiotica TaxID=863227 RepID=A0A2T3XSS6_9BURK|nr:ACP synthase [Trinickia symbiotica]PTB19568.1 ACP synthase [Trinickia symbiotica]
MKQTNVRKQETTYEEIVATERRRHSGRLAELKRAEKLIRAIAPDLRSLSARGVCFSVGDLSMMLENCRPFTEWQSRRIWALRIWSGSISQRDDQLIEGFIGLGWRLESVTNDRLYPRVVLRRPKTRLRVTLEATVEFATALRDRTATECAPSSDAERKQ